MQPCHWLRIHRYLLVHDALREKGALRACTSLLSALQRTIGARKLATTSLSLSFFFVGREKKKTCQPSPVQCDACEGDTQQGKRGWCERLSVLCINQRVSERRTHCLMRSTERSVPSGASAAGCSRQAKGGGGQHGRCSLR